jgi:hypothetical protein
MSNGNMGGDNLEATGMQRGRGRHAAISRNLSSWANYKNWSERMKDSFESDQPAEKKK